MYETYLQNEREFDEKFPSTHDVWLAEKGNLTISEYSVPVSKLKSHNRLSRIKEMKALEKELEGEKKEEESFVGMAGYYDRIEMKKEFNKGLQLSLDKIREFIKLLEKGV